jgi:hypothetical protein
MFNLARSVLQSLFIAVFIFLLRSPIFSQSSLSYGWYINVNGGITQLHGDIQKDDNPFHKLNKETSGGGGIKIGKYLNSIFTAHLQLHGSEIIGQNEKKDLEFLSDLYEGQLGVTLNFTNLVFGKKERRVNIYGTAGAGIVLYRSVVYQLSTKDVVSDFDYIGNDNGLNIPENVAFYFPLGAGLDFKLSKRFYLNLESTLGIFSKDEIDATVKGSFNDAYHFTSLGLTYYFKEREKLRIPTSRPLEEKKEIALDPFANEYVNLIYKLPPEIKSFDEFQMTSEIHKGKIDGPGTLTQVLPVGFNVLDTAIANARTDFNMFTLHLNWDNLPADSVFLVSYRVKVDRIFGTLPMASILYLQKTGKEYKFKTSVDIIRHEEPVAEKQIVTETQRTDSISTLSPIEYRIQISASYKVKIPLRELTNKIIPKEEIKEDLNKSWYVYTVGSFKTYAEAKVYMQKRVAEYGLKDAFIVVFYKGVKLKSLTDLQLYIKETAPIQPVIKKEEYCYRVQILAVMGKSVDPMSLKSKYKLEENVNEETYHNWHKYTVGPCSPKSDASLLLKKIKASGLSEAFIVTYKDGERVIVK